MPDYRYAFIPATPLALALYDGPLLPDGQPLPPDQWPAKSGFAAWVQALVRGQVRPTSAERALLALARENVPGLLEQLRAARYRLIYYALPTATAAHHAAARALMTAGVIDDYIDAPDLKARVAAAALLPINARNSWLILTRYADFPAWAPLGFAYDGSGGNVALLGKYNGPPPLDFDYLAVNANGNLHGCRPHRAPNQLLARASLGLKPDTVLYVEPPAAPPMVRAFFRRQHPRIAASLAAKNLRYLHWPDAAYAAVSAPAPALTALLRYQHPTLRGASDAALTDLARTLGARLTPAAFGRAVLDELGLPEPEAPLLLRHIEGLSVRENTFTSRVFAPPEGTDAEAWLEAQLAEYLQQVGRHPDTDVRFSLRLPSDDELASADWRFPDEGQRLPPELVAQIAALKAAAPAAALLDLLFHVADQLTETHPAVKQALLPLLAAAPPILSPGAAPVSILTLSPLVVDAHFRLWLPAFGDLEIKLTPLPKMLLFFFLRQPVTGLMLHDLVDHQPALLALYQQLQPDVDAATARARIADLVDVRANSINEKCSRIKEAFVREMADDVARHYYLTGQRGGPKSILLPRELVRWTT